jgi:hypothetical protein
VVATELVVRTVVTSREIDGEVEFPEDCAEEVTSHDARKHKARKVRIAQKRLMIIMKRKVTDTPTSAKDLLAGKKGAMWGRRSVFRHRAESALSLPEYGFQG